MRRTQEEAEKTKSDLLAAGLKVFSKKGYQATRLNDIATAAKVTRGAIYHHFGGGEQRALELERYHTKTSSGHAVGMIDRSFYRNRSLIFII